MKKWPWIVSVLYVLVLMILLVPLSWVAFGERLHRQDVYELLGEWQFWALLVTMLVAQWSLLRIPVCLANNRPLAQRPVWVTVAAAGLMMGALLFSGALCLVEVVDWNSSLGLWLPLGLGAASWIGWAIYFRRETQRMKSTELMHRLQSTLWKGSVLELLVAIPSHIFVRHRDKCCAGMLTFVGLSTGLAVMLFAFGPAVYFLFVERCRRKNPQS